MKTNSRSLPFLLCVLVMLFGAALRVIDMGSVRFRSPDENVYASQAQKWSASGIRFVADEWENRTELAVFPSPVRIGYLLPLRIAQALTGDATPDAGAELSCVASILSLGLVGVIAWRHLSPTTAPIAMALFAVCPPELMAARRAWMESFTGCLGTLLLLLMLECLRRSEPRAWLVAAGALAGWTVTVKETSVSQAGLLLLLLCIAFVRQQRWRDAAIATAAFAVTATLGAWWVNYSIGGYNRTVEFFHRSYTAVANAPYGHMYETGTAASWIKAIWIADPLLVSLAVIGIALLIANRNTLLFWSAATSLLCFSLPLTTEHRMNLRYASLGWVPLCFLAAAATVALWQWLKRHASTKEQLWVKGFAIAVFCLALAANYMSFRERFVSTDLQDLSLHMVLNRPLPVTPER